jgi:hypothetical protein
MCVVVARIERSEIREASQSGAVGPGFRGACHRARIRATRWLNPDYGVSAGDAPYQSNASAEPRLARDTSV